MQSAPFQADSLTTSLPRCFSLSFKRYLLYRGSVKSGAVSESRDSHNQNESLDIPFAAWHADVLGSKVKTASREPVKQAKSFGEDRNPRK